MSPTSTALPSEDGIGLGIVNTGLPRAPRPRRKWSSVARLMVAIAVIAVVSPPLGLVVAAIDAASRGPYSTWFNERCRRLVDQNGLIGRPEADVLAVLGLPNYRYLVDPETGSQTLNYCPFGMPFGKFQVHFTRGVVGNVEQFDD